MKRSRPVYNLPIGRKKDKVLKDAILGIDIGSTATRLFLLTCSGWEAVVESGVAGDNILYAAGDISSSCYPFDGLPPYIGNAIARDRIATSIKPLFLLLSDMGLDKVRPLVREYPHTEELLRRAEGQGAEQARFRENLKGAVTGFFELLRARLMHSCRLNRVRVTSVGVATPAHWPQAIQATIADYLNRKLLKPAAHVQVARDDVFFHTETQAMAHYLFGRYERRTLNMPPSNEQRFLLADFGGQNLNISTYHARRGPKGALVFYELDDSVGIVGGSQLQDHCFGRYCEDVLASQGHTLSDHQKQYFMTEFHRLKKEIDSAQGLQPYMRTIHCDGMHIEVTTAVIKMTLNNAIRRPFRTLTEIMGRWGRLDKGQGTQGGSNADRGLQVVASGGTVRSSMVKDYIADACESVGFNNPIFVDELSDYTGTHYPSVNVANGAAYATANVVTVTEFVERGAALGVQIRQSGERDWDNRAAMLYSEGKETVQILNLVEGDELKLICDPFFNPALKSTTLFYRWAYDVFAIGVFRAGRVQLRAAFAPHRDSPDHQTLVLNVMWHPAQDRPPAREDWIAGEVTLPLRFDRSSSCILVNLDQVTGGASREALVDGPQATKGPPCEALVDGSQATAQGDAVAPLAVMQPGVPVVGVLGIGNGGGGEPAGRNGAAPQYETENV